MSGAWHRGQKKNADWPAASPVVSSSCLISLQIYAPRWGGVSHRPNTAPAGVSQQPKRRYSAGKPGRGLDTKEIARRLAAKGAEAFRAGNLQEAVEHLQMAIDHDENCDRAHYFMGVALVKVPGRERDALRHLERAVALDSHNATYKAHAAYAAWVVSETHPAD